MSTPAMTEQATTEDIKQFALKVQASAAQDWAAIMENAEVAVTNAGLQGDQEIMSALGAMREAVDALNASAARLHAAASAHDGAAEQISGLGGRAATKTSTYQLQ